MRITRLRLQNWKNFVDVDVALTKRVFVVGANGSGKSNLLDALRFLYDIAKPTGGGLQEALAIRGGMKAVRSLFARKNPTIKICIDVGDESESVASNGGGGEPAWRYELELKQERSGSRRPLVEGEIVYDYRKKKILLDRPSVSDKDDPDQLTQTALEQTNANSKFRDLAKFLQSVRYLHMVPQLVRYATQLQSQFLPDDPFGQGLMNAIAGLPKKSQGARLKRIGDALKPIVPNFGGDVGFERDEKTGKPHIRFRHDGWRSRGVWQNEESLSDGALRLIGLLWTLMERNNVTLLEEPELSFNEGVVVQLSGIFARAILSGKKTAMQIILTTHSSALLSDEGIDGNEVLLLSGLKEGTKVELAADVPAIRIQLEQGIPISEAVLPHVQKSALVGAIL